MTILVWIASWTPSIPVGTYPVRVPALKLRPTLTFKLGPTRILNRLMLGRLPGFARTSSAALHAPVAPNAADLAALGPMSARTVPAASF